MRFAIAICLFALRVLAQTGILVGDGLPIPMARGVPTAPVQAKNVATGMVYKTNCWSPTAAFSSSKLPAGSYDITVPPIGFTFPKYEQKGVVIQAAQTAKLDIRLTWGGNLGTPGDDFPLVIRQNTKELRRLEHPAPRGRDGKPDFSAVLDWKRPGCVDAPDLLPWANEITKQRRARRRLGKLQLESCFLPGDNLLVSPFI